MTDSKKNIAPLLDPSLGTEAKLSQLNSELERLTFHFYSKAKKAKRQYHFYKYSSIVLAALTSIVASLQVIYPATFPKWLLPVTSALATVAVAFLGASGAQRLWVNSRTTGQQMLVEKLLFNQHAGRYAGISAEESLLVFSDRMVAIWKEGHGKWEQTVNDE